MILPRGITGSNVPKGHALCDADEFRAHCWQAAIALKGRVEDRRQELDSTFTSFMTQVIVLPEHEVTVLLNKVYPWVGFCRPLEPGDCWLEFVDPIPLTTSFAAIVQYLILSQRELDQPVTKAMCTELGAAELQSLKYWSKLAGHGKLRVGEVIFNFWD